MNQPTRKADRLKRLSVLLDVGMDLDEPARAEWLAGLRGDQAELGPTLREMLGRDAARETAELLAREPGFTTPHADAAASEWQAGDSVGPYRLLSLLGCGGMGEVWLAEPGDGQLKRQVALKLPVLGLRRGLLVQRFARERDILASLVHPHIARLYDAGMADDGQPYLALEYVAGVPITEHAQQRALSLRERVQLMRQVMDAVQFAHTHLVIHRDLKPGNVLVTEQGTAMLLDFGIAKLLDDEQGQAHETELTRLGGRALTLGYAAPEQISGLPVSTATDVHALGVLLYELLSGQRPFTGGPREVEQAIVSQDPARLRSLPDDLATIVHKALKKDPTERYATVSALSDDLGRWLRGEPVVAQPDRWGYRTRKFVARHRWPVALGSLVALAWAATGVVALWQAAEARQEAARAQQEARRAQAVQGFLLDLFKANGSTQADPQAAQRTTARELLDRGAAHIDAALADVPQSRIEVLATLADMYTQLGLDEQARSLQQRRVALARSTYGEQDPRLAQALIDHAETLQEGAHRADIPALLDEALALLAATGDATAELRGDALLIAARYWRYESLPRARQSADAAVAFFSRWAPQSTGLVTAHLLAARARLNAQDFDGALPHANQAMAVAQRQGDAAPAWQATPTTTLADVWLGQLSLPQAEASLRSAVALNTHLGGDAGPDTLSAKVRLGNLLASLGRTPEAEPLWQAARSALRTSDPRYSAEWRSYTQGLLGQPLLERGRPDLLAPALQAEIGELQRTLPHSPLLAHRERMWAEAQAALGQFEAARHTLATAQAHWAAYAAGEAVPRVDTSFALSRARIALAEGRAAEALAQLDPARPATPRDAIARDIERARALVALGQAGPALQAADAASHALDALPPGGRPVALQAAALALRRVLGAAH